MSDLNGVSVLLLEDEYMIALDAEDMLTAMGAQVVIAATLEDADAKAATGSFDVAVLDVNINGQRSYELAARVKAAGVPIVFASGYELSAAQGPDPGLEALVLTKPYSQQRLGDTIRRALSKRAAKAD
ncbi:MAG: response regulator [Alphaproteobacteria bacterium]|nr:response regulator [Alphaproteobacteria bacterium]